MMPKNKKSAQFSYLKKLQLYKWTEHKWDHLSTENERRCITDILATSWNRILSKYFQGHKWGRLLTIVLTCTLGVSSQSCVSRRPWWAVHQRHVSVSVSSIAGWYSECLRLHPCHSGSFLSAVSVQEIPPSAQVVDTQSQMVRMFKIIFWGTV